MPKVARDLANVEIKRLEKPGSHTVGHVPDLQLQITEKGSRSWVLRIRIVSKRREIGLGSARGMTLSQAKEYAAEIRRKVRDGGIDSVAERKAACSALLTEQAPRPLPSRSAPSVSLPRRWPRPPTRSMASNGNPPLSSMPIPLSVI